MNIFYKIKEAITSEIESYDTINKVTYGDISEVDLDKTTDYALAHYIVNTVSTRKNVYVLDVSVIFMDIVDDNFNNTDDVQNTMILASSRLRESFERGSLYDLGIQLDGESVENELFVDRFKDKVAGVTSTYSIKVANNMGICQ